MPVSLPGLLAPTRKPAMPLLSAVLLLVASVVGAVALGPINALLFAVLFGIYLPFSVVDKVVYAGRPVEAPVLHISALLSWLGACVAAVPFFAYLVGVQDATTITGWIIGLFPSLVIAAHLRSVPRILVPKSELAVHPLRKVQTWVLLVWAPVSLVVLFATNLVSNPLWLVLVAPMLGWLIVVGWPGIIAAHRARTQILPSI